MMDVQNVYPMSARIKPPARRTQAERSHDMRRRLVQAVLDCLAQDGYAGTTISRIVARARVSHGATGHHFASKDDLIVAAAEDLIRHSYRTLGELMLSIVDEDNRLEALVEASWERFYSQRMMRAYVELTIAAQRDPALAKALVVLAQRTRQMFETAVDHYFERAPGSTENPRALFGTFTSLLFGMAAQGPMLEARDVREHLRTWTRLTSAHLRARRGVKAPPPRPAGWDRPAVAAPDDRARGQA